MRKLFLLAGAVAAMASCASNDVYDVNPSNPDVITFGTYVGQATKGTVTDQDALKGEDGGFGIMAYQTEQEKWTEGATFTPDFMYNQEVTYNSTSSVWTYSPLKYWPNEEGDKVSFFTYAPYPSAENGISVVSENTSAGLPQIGFILNTDPSKMVDFVAGQNMDMVRQQDRVMFNLKHQLTRVTFSAIATPDNEQFGATAAGDQNSFVVVKSMDVVGGANSEFFTKGVYTHNMYTTNNDKTDHDQDGTWVVTEPIQVDYSLANVFAAKDITRGAYTGKGIDVTIGNANYTSLLGDGEYLFLLPPNADKGLNEDGITLAIAYDIISLDAEVDGGFTKSSATYTVTLPAGSLVQGKAYNYQLKFNASEILVDANIVDWDDSDIDNNGEVSPFEPTVDPEYDLDVNGDELSGLTTDNEGDVINGKDIISGDDAALITRWESTNPEVATVDSKGNVTIGGTAGTTTINGYIGDEIVVSYDITVGEGSGSTGGGTTDPVEEELTTNVTDEDNDGKFDLEDLFIGETAATNVTSDPAATITWSSSNENIATVDANGVVTGVAGGKATITGTTENGATIEFTVEVWSKFLGYTTEDVEVKVGETETVTFTATFEKYVDANYREPLIEDDSYTETNSLYVTLANEDFSSDLRTYSADATGIKAISDKSIFIKVTAEGELSNNTFPMVVSYITVVADDPMNGVFEGDYVHADGTTGPSKSGAIGYIYHVNREEGYALAISPSVGNVYNWGPNESTYFGANNSECGYYNGAKLYNGTEIGKIQSCQVIYDAWKQGTVAALQDDNDPSKGQWYCPANEELAEMRSTNTEWSKIMTYTGTTGYNVMWSSTEKNAAQAYLTFNDYQSGNYSAYGKTSVYSGWSKRAVYRIIKF